MPLDDLSIGSLQPSAVGNTTDDPPAVYWSDADVLAGKPIWMPTGRVASLHRVEPDGRRIFITPSAQLLCEHGERPSTILSWVAKEARAVQEGEEPPTRNSLCDCLNTDGLYYTKSKPQPPPEELPPTPLSLFSFLEELDTQKVSVHGRVQRHVPHTTGNKAMYLTQKGGLFVCQHAHTLSTLRKMRKVRCCGTAMPKFRNGGMCDCELDDLPQRTGLKSLPKLSTLPGKFGEAK